MNDENCTPIAYQNPGEKYVAKDIEIGNWSLSNQCKTELDWQESVIAESINISGAPVNIYKMLGIYEQEQGSVKQFGTLYSSHPLPGFPISGISSNGWKSLETGEQVLNKSFIAIDFGTKSGYAPDESNFVSVGCLKIKQSVNVEEYARQVKVEFTDGELVIIGSSFIKNQADGNITIHNLGGNSQSGFLEASYIGNDLFSVKFRNRSGVVSNIGNFIIGEKVYTTIADFTITSGLIPFDIGDTFAIEVDYVWKRLGLYSVNQSTEYQTINFQTKRKVRGLRIKPIMFTGVSNWVITGFDVIDSVPTDINNIQDLFYYENRDRQYSKTPIPLKVIYQPQDASTYLGIFGSELQDQFIFSVSFAQMVRSVGRVLVTGDVVEVSPEVQYDHNLNPVKRYLQIQDTSWAADGFTPSWKPIIFKFTATQLKPSNETKDIFGTNDGQQYIISDDLLLDKAPVLNPYTNIINDNIIIESKNAVPEIGSNEKQKLAEIPKDNILITQDIQYAGPAYIKDGLPKNGEPYTEVYRLPLPQESTDGQYIRLLFPEGTDLPPELHKFSSVKNKWILQEVDERTKYKTITPKMEKYLKAGNRRKNNV